MSIQSENIEHNRQRYSWLMAGTVVVLLIGALLLGLLNAVEEAERQAIRNHQQNWAKQLSAIHGMWIAENRPAKLRVAMARIRDTGEIADKSAAYQFTMNQSGWPSANSPAECKDVWGQILGSPLYTDSNDEAVVDYDNQRCIYQLYELGRIFYWPSSGTVSLEWL